MTDFISPLDIKTLIMQYFLGGEALFAFAVIIGFSMLAAKIQMSGRLFITLLILISLLFAGFLGQAVYILIFLLLGILLIRPLTRLFG